MDVRMIRSKIKSESANEVEAAVKRMFAAIGHAHPDGIRYASCRQPDGSYVAFLQLDDGVENPLPQFPEAREFQEGLKNWAAEPPSVTPLTVVASYRLFEDAKIGSRS